MSDNEEIKLEQTELQSLKTAERRLKQVCAYVTVIVTVVIFVIILHGYCKLFSNCILDSWQGGTNGLVNFIEIYKPLFQFLSMMAIIFGLGLASLRSRVSIVQTKISQKQFSHSQSQFLESGRFDRRKEFRSYVNEFIFDYEFRTKIIKKRVDAYAICSRMFNQEFTNYTEEAKQSIIDQYNKFNRLKSQMLMYLRERDHMSLVDDEQAQKKINEFDKKLRMLASDTSFIINNQSCPVGFTGTFDHIDIFEDSMYVALKSTNYFEWQYGQIDDLLRNTAELRDGLKQHCNLHTKDKHGLKLLLVMVGMKRAENIERKRIEDNLWLSKLGVIKEQDGSITHDPNLFKP